MCLKHSANINKAQIVDSYSPAFTVLVVTNAVSPSSVAGSGILCSGTLPQGGSPPPFSRHECFAGSLCWPPCCHCRLVIGSGCWWRQGGSAAGSSAFWRSSRWPSSSSPWPPPASIRATCSFECKRTVRNLCHRLSRVMNRNLCFCFLY